MLTNLLKKNIVEKNDKQLLREGVNLVSAINAHMKWKFRLQEYIEHNGNHPEGPLNHEIVCQDDKCALGKWIHGDAQKNFSRYDIFPALKSEHAKFHQLAGSVINYVHNKEIKEALLLVSGEYHQVSRRVINLITQLNADVQEGKNMQTPEHFV